MAATGSQETYRDKVRAHRARLRELGVWPVQFWVPDVRSDEFRASAHNYTNRHRSEPIDLPWALNEWL